MRRQLLRSGVLVFAFGVAHADELVLPNGDHWTVDGTTLHRSQPEPALDATMNLYSIGIACAAGLKGAANADKPAYLPPSFYASAFEQAADKDNPDAYATVCADLPPGVLVANLLWKGELPAASAAAFRDLLDYLARAFAQNPPPSVATVPLFDPPTASVLLDARTGVWNFVRDRTNANVTMLVPLWPKASVLLQLQRSQGAQQCSSVGFDTATPRPTWAPERFYAYGAHRDGAGFACLDGTGGRAVMVSVTENLLTPDDVQRVAALLEIVAVGLSQAPAPPPVPIKPE